MRPKLSRTLEVPKGRRLLLQEGALRNSDSHFLISYYEDVYFTELLRKLLQSSQNFRNIFLRNCLKYESISVETSCSNYQNVSKAVNK